MTLAFSKSAEQRKKFSLIQWSWMKEGKCCVEAVRSQTFFEAMCYSRGWCNCRSLDLSVAEAFSTSYQI